MASSLAGCLHLVGYDMLRVCDVTLILDVGNHLQDMGHSALQFCAVLACVWLPLGVSFLAPMSSGLGHTAIVGVTVICLYLAGACGAFWSLGLVAMACLMLLVVLLALQLAMLTGLRGCACLAVGDKRHLIFECAALGSFMSWYADLATGSTDTMKSFFAQPGHIYFYHMGVLQHVADCLSDRGFYEDLNMMPNLAVDMHVSQLRKHELKSLF